jgi:hypothetical protein
MKISPPAFPTYLADNMAHGMSLRDYFAAAAMLGFVAADKELLEYPKSVANFSYEMADEMLKAREE